MRFFVSGERGEATTNFDEAELAERAMTMRSLRTDVEGAGERGSSTRNPRYNKLMAKMHKYNAAAPFSSSSRSSGPSGSSASRQFKKSWWPW
jgi:hypothetical protein